MWPVNVCFDVLNVSYYTFLGFQYF